MIIKLSMSNTMFLADHRQPYNSFYPVHFSLPIIPICNHRSSQLLKIILSVVLSLPSTLDIKLPMYLHHYTRLSLIVFTAFPLSSTLCSCHCSCCFLVSSPAYQACTFSLSLSIQSFLFCS